MSFITNFMWAVKIVPQADKKTPDDSNMLHMFKNNTYTDFRTA